MIQEKGGYNVTVVAEQLPTDPKSIHYTSHWAVCLVASLPLDLSMGLILFTGRASRLQ